jgi:hypothetical protein
MATDDKSFKVDLFALLDQKQVSGSTETLRSDLSESDLSKILDLSEPLNKNLSFNINNFRSEIRDGHILKPSRFIMWLELPKAIQGKVDQDFDEKILLLRCESTNLPGVSMATSEAIRRYGYGRVERRPYLPTFSNLNCSFIMDQKALVHQLFYQWMNYIVNFNVSQGMQQERPVNNSDIGPYELSYKKDFKCPSMNLNIFDDYSNRVMVVRLFEAFPHVVSDVPLSWGATDQFMTVNVSFYFADYVIEYDEIGTYSPELPDKQRKRKSILGDITTRLGDRISGEVQDKIYTFGDRQLNKIFF